MLWRRRKRSLIYVAQIEWWMRSVALMILLTSAGLIRGQERGNREFHPRLGPATAHMTWTQRDGAPVHIAALAQTTDGYLWIGSSLGLYRFDGVQFASYPVTSLDVSLPSSDVESLAADQKGGLWIGFRLGGISHLGLDGSITNYNRRNGLGPGEVQKLMCRSDGSVWALGDGKLIILQNGRWQNFGVEHGLPNDELYTFYFDRQGTLWTAARQKVFRLKKSETKFTLYPMKSFAVVDFGETPDGQLWVSDAWRSVHSVEPGIRRATIVTKGLARIAIEPSGTIWMAQDYRGISHVSADQPTDVVKESAVSEQTEAILRDSDGNIWVGSSLGLDRFQASMLQSLSGLRLEYYPSLAADPRGGVWVATHEHSLLHVNRGIPVPIGRPVGSSPVVCDGEGRVWLVDPVFHDLVRYSDSGVLRVPNPRGSDLMVAQSIGLDLDGSPLVDFLTKGLWRYDGRWHQLVDPALPDEDVLAILRESGERVWFGFAYGRIVMRDAIGFHELPVDHDSNIGNVLALASIQGRIWAGGTDGVMYFDGRAFHKLVLRNGTALRGVSGIVEDKSHDLWFNARAGIVRIVAGEVQKEMAHSETPLAFDVLDERQGLAGSATQLKPTPSAVAEKGGMLVFSTDGHVSFLDPARVSFHRSRPNVMIENASVNGSTVSDREHPLPQIKVNAGFLRSLEIDYIGIDLTSPEKTSYRYIMEGEDVSWQKVGNRRQAFYSHLRPGTYRFRIVAGSEDDAMVELSAPLVLTVTPTFYQTPWFAAICGLLVLTILYFAYLLRMQFVTNRLKERLKERSSERIRIARELHDTLLQSVQGLMLRFHFATEALPPDEPARHALQVALSRADDVIVEGRRRVQDLREEVPDVADFAAILAAVGLELEMQKAMSFQVTEDGERQELNPVVQSELCKIAREALTNALRHSGATAAEIVLNYASLEFVMKCSDNGVGLSPSILSHGKRDGHWGLVGMRERTSAIKATMELWSSPDEGTEVEIRIPGKIAYRFPRRPTGLLRLLSQHQGSAEGTCRK
jgi:signal transduction histidine kinase/ligand-binding sensor domain-containing protein